MKKAQLRRSCLCNVVTLALFAASLTVLYAACNENGRLLRGSSSWDGRQEEKENGVIQSSVSAIQRKRIPNVLLAGVQKAGTTASSEYFFSLPTVCRPKAYEDKGTKETHFFAADGYYNLGIDHYAFLYDHCPDDAMVLMDATPKHILFPERVHTAYEEHGTAREVKIIFILREPVSRDISLYRHMAREFLGDGSTPQWILQDVQRDDKRLMNFDEYLDKTLLPNFQNGSERGLYASFLERWFKLFDRSQIYIDYYENFIADPEDFLERMHQFLDLPVPENTIPKAGRTNTSDGVKIEPISCETQQRLARMFDKPNEDLYQLLIENPGPSMEKPPKKYEFKGCKEY